jgi:hypothetical protein
MAAVIINDMFKEVRSVLRDDNKNNYPDALMTNYYNRAIYECWSLMIRIGADVLQGGATIVTDGTNQTYTLPTGFQAFVIDSFLKRVVTGDGYRWGKPLKQVGNRDGNIITSSTATQSPLYFFLGFADWQTQAVTFSTLPPTGEIYDYKYYTLPPKTSYLNIETTYTPYMGFIDPLVMRILEQFCREGLEFITTKRDQWRAKAEADIIELLGLRHLEDVNYTPSMWQGMPT